MSIKNPIIQSVAQWFHDTFSDPDAITLVLTLVLALVFLELFATIVMPVLVSVVIAYLLNSIVRILERWHCPSFLAVMIVYILFLGTLLYAIFGLLPLLFRELSNLVYELPNAFDQGQVWANQFIKKYPSLFSAAQIDSYTGSLQQQLANAGQIILKYTLSSLPNIVHAIFYLVLVPLFVFFFMKDRQLILNWLAKYKPRNRGLSVKVWKELNDKIGAYVGGRVIEMIIVSVLASIIFAAFGLEYAILLGVAVGLSVIIPYVGAIVVTIPVLGMAFMQFGASAHFAYILIAYTLLAIFDGNFLVPYLFSHSMDLHPLVIILAVVVFGGIWGFWGVFFAIPLATLIDVILRAWPTVQHE